MHFEWIFSPITQYIVLVAGLSGCLALFISARQEARANRQLISAATEWMHASMCTLHAEVQGVRTSMGNIEAGPPSPPPGSGLNLSRRARALRMHRRGEAINTIAPALEAPRNEIELLLKVERLINPRHQ